MKCASRGAWRFSSANSTAWAAALTMPSMSCASIRPIPRRAGDSKRSMSWPARRGVQILELRACHPGRPSVIRYDHNADALADRTYRRALG